MTAAYVIMALCVLLGVPFTLWWWRSADQWADAENRRFKPMTDDSLKDAVVVRWDGVKGEDAPAKPHNDQP